MNTSTATDLVQDLATLQRRNEHLEKMQVQNERTMADQAKLIGELTESIRIVRDHRDELRGQLERATDIAVEKAVRVTDLENELAGARVIIEARDNRVVQLEKALERRNGLVADATEAAEEYRSELKRALEGIAALAHSTLDPQD